MPTSLALAQDAAVNSATEDLMLEEVIVKGIRGSLANALDQKRNADSLVEVIIAEDIGKLPDQNLAGGKCDRCSNHATAGVGTGVQIRGTNANQCSSTELLLSTLVQVKRN